MARTNRPPPFAHDGPATSPWSIATVFEAVVDRCADREAVVAATGRLTFGQLDERANRLAHVLTTAGVRPGDAVGLVLRNRPEHVEALLACFKARAVPVNVNRRYTPDELHHVLADAQVAAVLHEASLTDVPAEVALEGPEGEGLLLRLAPGPEWEARLAEASPERPAVGDRSGDDRYVLYTGGTTGKPKGVTWRQEDVFFAALGGGNASGEPATTVAEAAANAARGSARCLPASPITHGTAQWTVLSTLLSGSTVVLAQVTPFDPVALWAVVEAEHVSQVVVVGDAFARPLAEALTAHPDRWDLSEVVAIVSGGAVLSPAVRQLLLDHLPWAVVVDGYGTSETGGQGHLARFHGQPDGGLPRFEVDEDSLVLDESLRPLAPGSPVAGLLARRGRVPLGYHRDPERTAQTFPVVDGERLAIPGDLAIVEADGRITLLGRGSSVVNTGGEKVHPEEVEAVLKGHPTVFDAVVVGVPDERWGEEVAAVVRPRPGSEPTLDALVEHCRAHLAPYKAPRLLVLVDDLRRQPSGKPDHEWARAIAQEAAMGPDPRSDAPSDDD